MELSSSMDEILESGEVVRLGCFDCDRADFDFITREQLAAAIAAGWRCVVEIQSLEESLDDDRSDGCPLDGCICDWETHRGICDRCWAGGSCPPDPLPPEWRRISPSWDGVA